MTDIIDRLRVTVPTEQSQQAHLTFEQRAMLDAADEIKRLRSIIRNYIKAEQDLIHAANDYFVVNYDEEVYEAHQAWKASWRALEAEAERA